MTQLAFVQGHPLQHQQAGLQVILQKSAGSILIDKLRAIPLMEADFNIGNKLYIGYWMMQEAIYLT